MKPLWERQLEEDLDWRMAELAALKWQILRHNKSELPYTSLLRALCAMLYAHYEGFCLFALNVYLEELEKAGIKRGDCRPAMIIFSLEEHFRYLRGDTSSRNCFDFFSVRLRQVLGERLAFERDPKTNEFKLKGRSNLYPAELAEQCQAGCLEVPAIVTYYQELRALVSRRNDIAHGRKVVIDDLAKYKPYEDAAVAVMHELAYAIITALNDQGFLAQVPEYYL
jgi:hypothetical protein